MVETPLSAARSLPRSPAGTYRFRPTRHPPGRSTGFRESAAARGLRSGPIRGRKVLGDCHYGPASRDHAVTAHQAAVGIQRATLAIGEGNGTLRAEDEVR